MSENSYSPPSLEKWLAQSLRLTVFPFKPVIDTHQDWLTELGCDDFELVKKKHERSETGVFQETSLSLMMDLLRLQWTVSHQPVDVEEFPTTFNIGKYVDRKTWFRDLMIRWLPHCPPIFLMAFGGVLVIPVEDRVSGYQLLNRFLRSVNVDPETTDFLYRVNRPTVSQVFAPRKINRLTTWVVTRFIFKLSVESLANIANEKASISSESFACSLEFDINTDGENTEPLPADKLIEIFGELLDFSDELATNGA